MSLCPPIHRSFSDEHGPGTFLSLGDLPKRKQNGLARFHLFHDDNDGNDDEHAPVPFPRSTSPPSHSPPQPRFSRDPVLLSNGKPLKSSLKSSTSSPAISTPSPDHHTHLRARSEPSTPAVSPKNVHFPEKDYALATVRVYHRSARPAALSSPPGSNGDETETEGEDTPPTRFPFPPIPSVFNYEIDPTKSFPIPRQFSPPANLIIESLNLSPSSSSSLATKTLLTGSVLVRNLSFEKHVAVRFTLDDWQTVSEVGTRYLDSLPRLPSKLRSSSVSEDTCPHKVRGWDRFTFTIRLEDHAHSLTTRTLWLAARYRVNSTYPEPGSDLYGPGGEWWDNNGGRNYSIGFRPALAPPTSLRSNPRRQTVSASTFSPPTPLQPAMACREHAFGHMASPPPSHQENHLANQTDKRPVSLRAGKLSLCNYVPPTMSPSSITNSELSSSATMRLSSDEETPSPASSAPSTPSLSPIMVPRVIISGQPATIAQPSQEEVTGPTPGYIADWDWPAPSKHQFEGLLRQRTHPVPAPELPERQRDTPSGKPLVDGRSVYDTFVRQWCFAQGPPPNHHGYDGGGIMA